MRIESEAIVLMPTTSPTICCERIVVMLGCVALAISWEVEVCTTAAPFEYVLAIIRHPFDIKNQHENWNWQAHCLPPATKSMP